MNIEKLPSGAYRARQMYKGKTYRLLYDYKPSKAQVELDMAEEIRRQSSAVSIDTKNKNMTIADACRAHNAVKEKVISPSTLRGYDAYLRNIPEEFKQIKLADVNAVIMQKFVNDFSDGHEPHYVKNVYNYISTCLRMFISGYNIKCTLPAAKVVLRYEPTDADVKALICHFKGTEYEVPIILACYGVCRSEMCAIDASDVEGDIIHIHKSKVQTKDNEWIIKDTPKTSKRNRRIAVPQDIADKIKEQGFVYYKYPNMITDNIYSFCDAHKIPRFSVHMLRHYFCSKMSALGVSEADVLAMGGWKTDYVMKQRYRYSMMKEEEQKRATSAKLASALFD